MLTWSNDKDFNSLLENKERHSKQTKVEYERVKTLTACLFHYNLLLPSVIRYLGPEYTGEYRDSTKIIETLTDAKCPQDIINDVDRILNVGCPNYLNDTSLRGKFLQYIKYGNHVSTDKNTEKVLKAMNKDEKNNYIIPFPKILTCLIPDLHLTPQGLLIKLGKNDRSIWDGTFTIDHNSKYINMMMDNKTNLKLLTELYS